MYKEGVIENISIKERKTGQFGDFAGFSIKIDGVWYSAGLASADKHTNELIPRDKDKKQLKEGMKVDFKYTTNDKGYHEVEKGTLAILGSQTATSNPPTNQPTPQPTVHAGVVTTAAGTAMKLNALDISVSIAALEYRDCEVPQNLTAVLLEKADKIVNWAAK